MEALSLEMGTGSKLQVFLRIHYKHYFDLLQRRTTAVGIGFGSAVLSTMTLQYTYTFITTRLWYLVPPVEEERE
jgi:hypothetical protein